MIEFMNDLETASAELRKTADYYDGVAGKWLANLTTEQYAERLERLSAPGDRELAIHRASITALPPYVRRALTDGDVRTLKAFRERRGAETLHLDAESWWAFGGKAACAARGI